MQLNYNWWSALTTQPNHSSKCTCILSWWVKSKTNGENTVLAMIHTGYAGWGQDNWCKSDVTIWWSTEGRNKSQYQVHGPIWTWRRWGRTIYHVYHCLRSYYFNLSGDHKICFGNAFSKFTEKLVLFTLSVWNDVGWQQYAAEMKEFVGEANQSAVSTKCIHVHVRWKITKSDQ